MLFLAFAIGGAMTVFILALGTISATLGTIWQEQERAYDVFVEHMVIGPVQSVRRKIIQNGADNQDWRVNILDEISKYAYQRAVTKIPKNDFERLEFFWNAYYRDIFYVSFEDQKQIVRDSLPVFISVFKQEHSGAASAYIRDSKKPAITAVFSAHFLTYGEYLPEDVFTRYADLAWDTGIDAISYVDYKDTLKYPGTYSAADLLLALNSLYRIRSPYMTSRFAHCDRDFIQRWQLLDEKVLQILQLPVNEMARFAKSKEVPIGVFKLQKLYKTIGRKRRDIIEKQCNS